MSETQASAPPEEKPSRGLLAEFNKAQRDVRDMWKIWGPGVFLTLLGFAIAWFFVEPAPPNELTIATGSKDGAYYRFAQQYAEVFAEEGVTLNIIETNGSVENYKLLAEQQEIHLAIVQGGISETLPPAQKPPDLEAIASLFLEPVWVFTHGQERLTELTELKGKTIAIGKRGSGTFGFAMEILKANGYLTDESQEKDLPASLQEIGGTDAADMVQSGEVDAAFFISSPQAEMIQQLLRSDEVRLMSFERQHAYEQRFPYVSSLTLSEGVVDFAENIPRQDIKQIAPAANLIATPEFHDGFIPLLLRAVHHVHARGGMYDKPGEFPSLRYVEFSVNPSAQDYFDSGPSFLHKYFPFWVASLVSRTKIMMLPLLTLFIPLVKVAPPVYRWRIRSRIYQWYGVLRDIDQRIYTMTPEQRETDLKTLIAMEQELEQINVPLSYMEEFYNLRVHIDLIHRRVDKAIELQSSQA